MKPFDYEFILKQIDYWQLIKRLWEESDVFQNEDSLDTATFKLYLRFGSVKKVADELNNLGYRIPNKNGKPIKLTSNDITEIIVHKHIENTELEEIVKSLQKNHKSFALKSL